MKISRSDAVLLTLPEIENTKEGIEYNPHDNIWRFPSLSQDVVINWGGFDLYYDAILTVIAKKVAIKLLRRVATTSVKGMVRYLLRCAEINQDSGYNLLDHIPAAHIKIYRQKCISAHKWHEGDVAHLKVFLLQWHQMKLPGIDPAIKRYFEKVKIKSRPTGQAIRINDHRKGAFTEEERTRIDKASTNGFSDGQISIEVYVLTTLLRLYAQRPIQYASLKHKDLIIRHSKDGTASYILNIPLAKGRGEETLSRTEFLPPKHLPADLGEIIEAQIIVVRQKYLNEYEDTIGLEDLPLFPAWKKFSYVPGFLYHSNAKGLGQKLSKGFEGLKLRCDETGDDLNIFSYRFRHTFATQCLSEGLSKAEIAALLGQRTTSCVDVYAESSPPYVENIDKAYAIALAPFRQAFKGKLIFNASEAKRNGDKASVIRTLETRSNESLGWCGEDSFCGAIIPYACYTCSDYEPWIDGPHEEFLRFLLVKREQDIERSTNGLAMIEKNRLATVHDLTIYGCAEVLRQCQEIKRIEKER